MLLFGSMPAFAMAQLTTDQVPFERTIPADVEVKSQFDHATWHLGPFRVLPWVSLHHFGYDNNVFASSEHPVGDWTATLGAGFRLYLPVGRKTFLRFDALPQYTWFKDFSERNQFTGRGEVAYLGFFNHLSFRLSGAYNESAYSILTSEVPALVHQTGWDAKAGAEVDLTRRIAFFAGFEVLRERVQDPGLLLLQSINVANYNRTDGVSRAGFRYTFSPGWSVSLAAEGTETRFVLTPDLRDNWGLAGLFGLHYDRPHFFVNLYAGYRIGRPLNGSQFPPFETPTGSGYLTYHVAEGLELSAFGSRKLTYGIASTAPYYAESRFGGGLTTHFLTRFSLGASGSYGSDDYGLATKGSGGSPARLDHVTVFTGNLAVALGRSVTLTAQANRTSYDSNVPSYTRSFFIFFTGLSFGLEFSQ